MRLSFLFTLLPLALATPVPVLAPRAGTPIPGKYIVTLKNDGNLQQYLNLALQYLKSNPDFIYRIGGFGAFTATIPYDILQLIQSLPGVAAIEQDALIALEDAPVQILTTQAPSTWGLARISHVNRVYNNTANYTYDITAGAGTCVYVLDTGVDVSLPEFEGRATKVANYVNGSSPDDVNGHGTFIASIVGSKTYGVAKKTMIYDIKVLGDDGKTSTSAILAGFNQVPIDAATRSCPNGVLVNFSTNGPKSPSVDTAISNLVAAGIFVAVAAGNQYSDASNYSPGDNPASYTVGATTINDTFAVYSNYGPSVDILAPGTDIISTFTSKGPKPQPGNIYVGSGTSFATPFVSGLGAYIQAKEGKRSATDLAARLSALANLNKINITGAAAVGTKNALAFNGNPPNLS